jgi:hypothetical protein
MSALSEAWTLLKDTFLSFIDDEALLPRIRRRIWSKASVHHLVSMAIRRRDPVPHRSGAAAEARNEVTAKARPVKCRPLSLVPDSRFARCGHERAR